MLYGIGPLDSDLENIKGQDPDTGDLKHALKPNYSW
jgi:hypothetical protein